MSRGFTKEERENYSGLLAKYKHTLSRQEREIEGLKELLKELATALLLNSFSFADPHVAECEHCHNSVHYSEFTTELNFKHRPEHACFKAQKFLEQQ